jgi:hypothetical protein
MVVEVFIVTNVQKMFMFSNDSFERTKCKMPKRGPYCSRAFLRCDGKNQFLITWPCYNTVTLNCTSILHATFLLLFFPPIIIPWIINSLDQIPSWEPDTCSAGQELAEFYTTQKTLTVFKSSIWSSRSSAKLAQFTLPPPYFFKIHYTVVLQSYFYTASVINYWDTNYEYLLT